MVSINAKQVILSILLVLFVSVSVQAQLSLDWTKQFGTSAADYTHSIAAENGVIAAGGTTSSALPGSTGFAPSFDNFYSIFDASGNQSLIKYVSASPTGFNQYNAVYSGEVFAAGRVIGSIPGNTAIGLWDTYVVRYDISGNRLWGTQFGTTSNELVDGQIFVDSTGVYLAGTITSGAFPGNIASGSYDVFAAKYDLSGNQIWVKQFGTASADFGRYVDGDSFNIYVTGYTAGGTFPGETNQGSYDGFVAQLDKATGNIGWLDEFGTSGVDTTTSLEVDSTGVFVAGYTTGSGGSLGFTNQSSGADAAHSEDAFVRKYDLLGNHLWTVQLTPSGASTNALANEEAIDMEVENNELYVLGNTTSPFKGPLIGAGDSFLLRLDPSNGSEIEGIQFGTTAIDASRSISVDGLNVYLIGTTQGDLAGTGNAGDYDIFVRKYLLPPTIIDDDSDTIDDSTDNCAPLTYCPSNYSSCYNPDQLDSDSDLAGDVCDSCPASVGSCSGSDSQTCDSSGCTLSVADPNSGGFNTITVPSGTLSDPTSFSMTMFDESPPGFNNFDVGGADVFSLFFVFTPSGLSFNPPITLELRYNDGGQFLAEQGLLTVYVNEGSGWIQQPANCVADADFTDGIGTCFLTVSNFTAFVVAGVSPEASKELVLSELQSFTGLSKKDEQFVGKAIDRIQDSLNSNYFVNGSVLSCSGKHVFDMERQAVDELSKVSSYSLVSDLILQLVEADKGFAFTAMNKSTCSEKDLERAQKEFDQGLEEMSEGNYSKAIQEFRNAWMKSKSCECTGFGASGQFALIENGNLFIAGIILLGLISILGRKKQTS